ncbi:MAG: menaquinone biosynthesis decarboxylase [Chitinophagales bacterium]|nr:menaquinone biosynthesis decarboxylase [Chitinophagales bacterium]MDW8428536.1 menaquinone biosynthesis decarboxylase [Chitinophagales bacterium]
MAAAVATFAAAMAFASLRDFVHELERCSELKRIKTFVDPKLQITEIVDRVTKHGGPALLFENTGTDFPLLINMFGTPRRMAMALGVSSLDDVAVRFEQLFSELMRPRDNILQKLSLLPRLGALASWMPKVIKGRGACQQVIMNPPDLRRLPIMTCWPEDGGPFITLPIIHTRDPHTGIRNVGMYRMQVFGSDLTALHWHKHKVSARHFQAYRRLNRRMPVAVALGGDPVYSYVATAPLPENVDEYILAGFIRRKAVELVKCLTNDLEVPADADIIIEGYVDPAEELILEGPFGDHTGFYSLPDFYPRFHVTCITHRQDAIYPSTIVGIPPQEDAWLGKATERIFLAPLRMTVVPEILDMELPIEGVFHNLTIIKIRKEFAGQAAKVCHAMWGAGQMMFNKMLIITDEQVDIHDYAQVARAITEHVDPLQDVLFSRGPMDVLDHACSKFAFGGKMAVDATGKLEEERHSRSMKVPLTALTQEQKMQLQQRWPEIKSINDSLFQLRIAVAFIALRKNRINHIKEIADELVNQTALGQAKFLIVLDAEVDVDDVGMVVWRWSNNFDPERDSLIIPTPGGPHTACLVMDGTRKTRKWDGFDRPWPNVICSDEATIEAVDQLWPDLGLGPLLPSPSRRYRSLLCGTGAVAAEPVE